MAPTVALRPRPGVLARRWARKTSTLSDATRNDDDEERFARPCLRRALSDPCIGAPRKDSDSSAQASHEGSVAGAAEQHGGRTLNEALLWADMEALSDSSVGALHKDSDSSTRASREGSVADAAEQRGGRTLNEALLWADMEDEEPLLAALTSPDGETAAPRRDHLLEWFLYAVDKPFAGDKPPSQFLPAGVQQCVLPVRRDAACGLLMQAGADGRTPLSSKSSPFVPWIPPPGATAPERKESATSVGDAKAEGSQGKAQLKARPENQTTVMLRGLPRCFSRDQLIQLLDARGYSGLINFVYLPVDFESSQVVGYAFINLKTAKIAEAVKESFEGLTSYPFSTSQPCSVSWSRVQGLGANIRHYRNSPVMHKLVPDEYKPVLLWDGVRRPFPEPTTALKELKLRRRGAEPNLCA